VASDEARSIRDAGKTRYQADGTVTPYEVRQGPTGLAEVYDGAAAKVSGDYPIYSTEGTFKVLKTSGVVILKGGRVYWDHSASSATYCRNNDRDFYLGRAVEDAASTAPTVDVILNVDPPYDIDLCRDGFISTLAGTPAAGGFGYPVQLGGAFVLELSATNEAQKVDLLSVDGFDLASNAIVEFAFRVISDGASGAQDFTIGVASGTHETDFQSVTSFVALHLDGNTTNINVQSDDNSTDVAPTDSTADYTEGSARTNRVEGWLDFRNPADVQCYVNGALVLDGTTFTAGTSGVHHLIAHLEKTAGTDTYKVAVDWLRARLAEQ